MAIRRLIGRIRALRYRAIGAGLILLLASAALASPPPWKRTEPHDGCADFTTLRSPYFGETHIHTTLSFDAVTGDVRADPRDAYQFAKGAPLGLPPFDVLGDPTRTAQLKRPLDFTAITDHSEFFGEVQICLTPGLAGYDSVDCTAYRNAIPQEEATAGIGIILFTANYILTTTPDRFDFCGVDDSNCLGEASLVWQDIQDAADEFYDRTPACSFTTFVGYEWTGQPVLANLHRNVIFRNDDVPALPTSYVDEPTPQGLWAALRSGCQESSPDGRCDVLAIPHNSNVSGGEMFLPENADGSPLTATDAAFRAAMEPVVELTQHKGDSECRPGALTNDELCGYEKWSATHLAGEPATDHPPLSYVRNAFKEGLVQEASLGTNPFRFGVIGATDSHNATPGMTREDDYATTGHLGTRDATPELMLFPTQLGTLGGFESHAGGLGVVWAEENSRDALFAAMRRREVYATSGTRPLVRFFGGRLTGVSCNAGDFVERAYKTGAPMGAEIGSVRGKASPRFAVLATKDPGAPGFPGTPLQRVQIIKGWVDQGGTTHEKVFEVAGDPDNGATVDTDTCVPSGTGFDSLCTIWQDPEFDRDQRAFYYARVVENPVCRWSTRLCNSLSVDCDDPGSVPEEFALCCDPQYSRTIQERAWTSPIWHRPEGIGRLKASVRFGSEAGTDILKLKLRTGAVPDEFDVDTMPLTLTLRDDDTVYEVTVPAGAMTEKVPGRRWVYRDTSGSLGGIRDLSFTITRKGPGRLSLRTVRMDLSNADATDHFVEAVVQIGTYEATHTRLWEASGTRLRPARS